MWPRMTGFSRAHAPLRENWAADRVAEMEMEGGQPTIWSSYLLCGGVSQCEAQLATHHIPSHPIPLDRDVFLFLCRLRPPFLQVYTSCLMRDACSIQNYRPAKADRDVQQTRKNCAVGSPTGPQPRRRSNGTISEYSVIIIVDM